MRKFRIDREKLRKAVSLINPIVDYFDINAISDSILLSLKEDKIEVVGRNNTICVKSILPVEKEFNESLSMILNAKTLIHIVNTNTVKELTFEVHGGEEDLEDGIGRVIIKGNSRSSLPIRASSDFPDFPDIEKGEYSNVNIKELVGILRNSESYVEKDSISYNSGICCGGGLVVATDRLHGLFTKYRLPIDTFVISPSVLSPISMLDEAKMSIIDTPNVLGIIGKIDDIIVLLSISLMHEEYPLEKTKAAIKLWLESESFKFSVNKSELSETITRMKGFIRGKSGFIEGHLNEQELKILVSFQQNESEEVLNVYGSRGKIAFRMNSRYWEEIIRISDEMVNVIIVPEYGILNIRNRELLYSASIKSIE